MFFHVESSMYSLECGSVKVPVLALSTAAAKHATHVAMSRWEYRSQYGVTEATFRQQCLHLSMFPCMLLCRQLCVSHNPEGIAAVMSAVAAAVQQLSQQQTILLETLNAVQVIGIGVSASSVGHSH